MKPYFWLIDQGTVGTNMHVAFTVDTREEVDTFYAAALARGRHLARGARRSTPSTTTTTTAASSTTRTASTSRPSATTRKTQWAAGRTRILIDAS